MTLHIIGQHHSLHCCWLEKKPEKAGTAQCVITQPDWNTNAWRTIDLLYSPSHCKMFDRKWDELLFKMVSTMNSVLVVKKLPHTTISIQHFNTLWLWPSLSFPFCTVAGVVALGVWSRQETVGGSKAWSWTASSSLIFRWTGLAGVTVFAGQY